MKEQYIYILGITSLWLFVPSLYGIFFYLLNFVNMHMYLAIISINTFWLSCVSLYYWYSYKAESTSYILDVALGATL